MASVLFKRGLKSGLTSAPLRDGTIYVTTDERAMYMDVTDTHGTVNRIRLGDFREYANFDTISRLSASQLDSTALYYASRENILCKWTGEDWIQINSQPTLSALVQDIYNSTSAVTGGLEVTSAFRNPDDFSTELSSKLKLISANPSALKITGTNNIHGEPTITFTPASIVYGLSTAVENDRINNGVVNLLITQTRTGTDADGNEVNTSETRTIPIVGSGITVLEENGQLVLQNSGGVESITNVFSSTGAFTTRFSLSDGSAISAPSITPKIQYGENEEAVFASGVAVLDVYTKGEVNARIQSQLRAANAMTFKGAVGTAIGSIATLPTSNVCIGDTYKVSSNGTYNQQLSKIGDMFIATGTESDSTGYITSGLDWIYIPSGNDDAGSALTLEYNSVDHTIDLVDENGIAVGSIGVGTDIVLGQSVGIPIIKHANVSRTNTTAADQIQGLGQGGLEFDVITGITTSDTGHVTGVEKTHVVIADELNTVQSVSASARMNNGDAEIQISVSDNYDVKTGSFKLHSESLALSASGSTTNVEVEWGSF